VMSELSPPKPDSADSVQGRDFTNIAPQAVRMLLARRKKGLS
jgi:hypothetical protein